MTTVALDRRFYARAAVDETIEAFGHLAKITVSTTKDRIELSFDEIDSEVGDVLVDEFLNYALATTISNRGS